MKLSVIVRKAEEIDLTDEDCERVLINTLHDDWYAGFRDVMPESDKDAFKRVYYIYSARTLV